MVEREERIVERDTAGGPPRDPDGPGRGLIIGVVAALLVAGLIVVLIFAGNDDDGDGGTQTDDVEVESPDVEAPDVEAPEDMDVDVTVDDQTDDAEG